MHRESFRPVCSLWLFKLICDLYATQMRDALIESEEQRRNVMRSASQFGSPERLPYPIPHRAPHHASFSPPPADASRLQEKGVLRVHLHKGVGLKASDRNGKSDPYVLLSIGTARKQSRVEESTLDPVFNEDFEFEGTLGELLSHGLLLRVPKQRNACPRGSPGAASPQRAGG